METLQIDILDPKAKEMLEEMAAQELKEIYDNEGYKLSEEEDTLHRNKLKISLNKIQKLVVFNKINNSPEWQNELRNEWK